MHDEDKEQQPSSAETFIVTADSSKPVEVDVEARWKFTAGVTLEEAKESMRRFMDAVFANRPLPKIVAPPHDHPLADLVADSIVSVVGHTTVPAGTRIVTSFKPQSYKAEFRVDIWTLWWEAVRDEFADLLPDEEAAIVMLGGSRCPQLGIVRTGKRTFQVHHRGRQVADITDLMSRSTVTFATWGSETADMVARAQRLAEHLGCSYGRLKPQRTWRRLTRRARERLGL